MLLDQCCREQVLLAGASVDVVEAIGQMDPDHPEFPEVAAMGMAGGIAMLAGLLEPMRSEIRLERLEAWKRNAC